jgi:hypothetical protein
MSLSVLAPIFAIISGVSDGVGILAHLVEVDWLAKLDVILQHLSFRYTAIRRWITVSGYQSALLRAPNTPRSDPKTALLETIALIHFPNAGPSLYPHFSVANCH